MRMSITRRSEISNALCSGFCPYFRLNQPPDEETCEKKLKRCGKVTGLVAASAAVEDLAAAGPRQRQQMLDVGGARGKRADGRRVANAARRREQRNDEQAAPHLERDTLDVLVRHLVTEEMQGHAEEPGARARAQRSPHGGSRRRMKRHDHPAFVADALKVVQPPADQRPVAVDSRLLGYWEAQQALRGGGADEVPDKGHAGTGRTITELAVAPPTQQATAITQGATTALPIDDR